MKDLRTATVAALVLASGLASPPARAADGVTATKATTTTTPPPRTVAKDSVLETLRVRPNPAPVNQPGTSSKALTLDPARLRAKPVVQPPDPNSTSIFDSLSYKATPGPPSQVRLTPLVRPKAIDAKTIQVPLDLVGVAPEKTRVLVRQGREWQPSSEALRVVNGHGLVSVPTGGSVVVGPTPEQGTVTKLLSRSGFSFPGAIIQVRNTPAGATQPELLNLSVKAITWPMSWDTATRRYVTRLRVFLTENLRQVSPAQDVRVRFSARHATVTPLDITLRANEAIADHYVTVTALRHDPVPVVTAESDLGKVENELAVDVGAPKLKVDPVTNRLKGFGLGSTTLVVTTVADDDIELVQRAPMTASVLTDLGTTERSDVTIEAGQSRSNVLLRSEGIGVAHIKVVGPFGTTNTEVDFAFPTVFLILVMLGGTIGGAMNWIRRETRARGGLGVLLLEGLLVGPVLVIAIVTGANFAGAGATQLVATDGGRFVLAVVFGGIGTPAVDSLRRWLLKIPDASDDSGKAKTESEATKEPTPSADRASRRPARPKGKGATG